MNICVCPCPETPPSIIDRVSGGQEEYVGLAPVDAPYTASLFRNLHIHTGVVPVGAYLHRLLPLVERGRIDPSIIFTDLLPLAEAERGYALMRDRSTETVKVALQNG